MHSSLRLQDNMFDVIVSIHFVVELKNAGVEVDIQYQSGAIEDHVDVHLTIFVVQHNPEQYQNDHVALSEQVGQIEVRVLLKLKD